MAALCITRWIFCRAIMDWYRFFYHVKQAIAQPSVTLCSVFISCKRHDTVFKPPSNFFLLQALSVTSPTTCGSDGTFNEKLPYWSYKSKKPYSNWSQSDRSLLGWSLEIYCLQHYSLQQFSHSCISNLPIFYCPFCKNDGLQADFKNHLHSISL